jgi:hypothetical protein
LLTRYFGKRNGSKNKRSCDLWADFVGFGLDCDERPRCGCVRLPLFRVLARVWLVPPLKGDTCILINDIIIIIVIIINWGYRNKKKKTL